jgi:2-dehydro-3-deoxyglucarate aldolase/4-hydroxy-2-oxoheptanedioate aldolase
LSATRIRLASSGVTPYDLHGLDDFCQAAELHGLGAMIKLDQEPRTARTAAVGAGFQAVLFADVRTAEDARACVRTVRRTPRPAAASSAADRRMSHRIRPTADYITALEEIVVVLMIEKRRPSSSSTRSWRSRYRRDPWGPSDWR